MAGKFDIEIDLKTLTLKINGAEFHGPECVEEMNRLMEQLGAEELESWDHAELKEADPLQVKFGKTVRQK